MSLFVARFLNDSAGATSIEYAMIAVGVAVAIVAAVNTLGVTVLNGEFNNVKNALNP